MDLSSHTSLIQLAEAIREVQRAATETGGKIKLVAWEDRWRRSPGKDAQDLFVIARKYLDAGNAERFFERDWEILERPAFDYGAAGAEVLGRDLAALCHGALAAFLTDLLARETDPRGSLMLAHQMAGDEEEGLRILVALRRGFEIGRAERA